MIRRTGTRMRLCIAGLVLILAFIWGNSLLPGNQSSALSRLVKGLVQNLLPGSLPGEGGTGLLRKLAHFCEFCALGSNLTWLFAMCRRKRLSAMGLAFLCGFAAACVDETIQRFVPGRGPSLRDVGIDSGGVLLGILLLTAGILLYQKYFLKNLEETQ